MIRVVGKAVVATFAGQGLGAAEARLHAAVSRFAAPRLAHRTWAAARSAVTAT